MSVLAWIKGHFYPLHVLLGYVFITSGLIVCFLMLLAYILVWPFNKSLYRKICSNLAYMHWCQFTFLGQWWSGSECTIHMEDPKDFRHIGHEHMVALMNHKYDIDWLMAWILSERFGMLGGTKIFGKSSLRFVPVLGWAWTFTESIFLKRAWETDKETISRDLKYIHDYPDGYWVTLLLFCEGTRFTEEKHAASMEVAKKKGLPLLKHHLLPRTKGFIQSMHGVQGKIPCIVDITVAFRDDGAAPTLMSVVFGKKCKAEMYLRRILIDDVPIKDDAKCAEWLHKLYQEKDEIYNHFKENGEFKVGTKFIVPRRINDLICWMMWTILLSGPLMYLVAVLFTSGSFSSQAIFVAIVLTGTLGVRLMIAVSETHKGSKYGNNNKKCQ